MTTTDYLELLGWPDLQPGHQPLPSVTPRALPPVQPLPLISGLLETVLTNSPTVPTANVNSKLVGQNTNPLVTLPPQAPSTSETLVVSLTPAPTGVQRNNAGFVTAPTGGAAVPATVMLTVPAAGTQLTALLLTLIPTDPTSGQPFVVVTAASGTNVVQGVLGLGQPISLVGLSGPIMTANLTIAVAARGAGAPACQIYYSVFGVNL